MPSIIRSCSVVLSLLTLGLLPATPARGAPPELTPPTLRTFVDARLPPGAPLVDRVVVLWVTIGEDGLVTEVELKEGAGSPWDEAAIEAARRLVFTPALEDGKPIPVRVPFTYELLAPKRRGRFLATRRDERAPERSPGHRLAGRVLEMGTRTPLAGIAVFIRDPETDRIYEATTHADGGFLADGLPPGALELVIATGEHRELRRRGLRGAPAPATGADTPPAPQEILYLDPVGLPQYRTVIKDRPKVRSATEVLLTEDELTKTPGTFGDPTRVVQSLPGVARSPFGLGYYLVRGANFENTGFFIDGHPAMYLYHLMGGPGVIHPELVGNLSFYPGGYPVRYGRFATGAVVVETKDPPDDRWHLDVEVDVLKASGLFSIPFDGDRGVVTASFRRSYYELLIPLFVDGVGLYYTDYQLRVSWDPSPKLHTRLLLMGAEDGVYIHDEGDGPGQDIVTSVGFHRVVADVLFRPQKGVDWLSSVAFEWDRTDGGRTAPGDEDVNGDIDGYMVSLRSGATFSPLDGLEIESGVDALVAVLGARLNIPTVPPLGDPRPPIYNPVVGHYDIDMTVSSVVPYVSFDWAVAGGVRVLPGIRASADTYAGGTHFTVDPRLAVRWQVHPEWTLTAMGALAHQMPQIFQVGQPFGDPEIPPVRGTQASLGVEWEPGDGWEVKLEGFFNLLDNLARPTNVVEGQDGEVARLLWSADERGRAFGLEVLVRKRIGGRFYGWLSYTFSRSERLRPPEDWDLFELDQTHVLNLAWTLRLGADWSVGMRFTLASGNPFYEVAGARYDADRDRYEPIYEVERSRLDVFHRLDVRVDKRWRFDTWMLEAYLDIQNVYNAGNPESPRYSFDYKIKTDGVGIPILPTVGLRAVF